MTEELMEERRQTWKKATRTQGANNCVELAYGDPVTEVRDSKAPDNGRLHVDLGGLLGAVKADRLAR